MVGLSILFFSMTFICNTFRLKQQLVSYLHTAVDTPQVFA